jgi:hypothetical protein
MVGGSGERTTLRFLAKYGDACNLFNGPQLSHKLDVLKRHCETEGRDYAEITKVVDHGLDIGPHGGAPDRVGPAGRAGGGRRDR